MKILQVHNHYQQKGGEDAVVDAEKKMLEKRGHTIVQYLRHNDDIKGYGPVGKAGLFVNTTWSLTSMEQIRQIIRAEQPDIAHFHNTLPLISPSAYYACKKAGVPVVQTLHNFRLLCPTGLMFRKERVCEECIRSLARSVRHGCYRDSRLQTSAVAWMLAVHRWLGTWKKAVDAYIVLNGFMKEKFSARILPEKKIFIKPNLPGHALDQGHSHQGYALFLGRLSGEKGVKTLVRAWTRLEGIHLKIAGDGPLNEALRQYVGEKRLNRVDFLGYVTGPDLEKLISNACVVIQPSECYEGMPLSVIEAFSAGKPVIASNIGAGAWMIIDKKNGRHFRPGDPDDLAAKVRWLMNAPKKMSKMGNLARSTYEARYTQDKNYDQLMDIYQQVIGSISGEKQTRQR